MKNIERSVFQKLKNSDLPLWTPEADLNLHADSKHKHTPDDLGNVGLFFSEELRRGRFDLSFLDRHFSDVCLWRAEVLGELKKALALPSHPRPVRARILSREKGDGYEREEVEFESAFGLPIPATVLIPSGGRGPFPAVVALHDMGGFRSFGREKLIPFPGEPEYLGDFRDIYYGGKSIGLELVARGVLVICIDSMMFGERTPPAQKDRAAFLRERLSWNKVESDSFSTTIYQHHERAAAHAACLVGRTWAGMIASDDLATVDYLASRPDVDARRLGCVGLSYGAYRTNYLAALDERIGAAVSVCWMATLDSIIGYNVGGCIGPFVLIPGIHTRLDLCDIASLAAPRPFMAISGWRDQLMQPHGIAAAHHKLRAIWRKAQAPDRLGSLCFDSPHEFNAAMQEEAFAWLDHWLRV